MPPVTAKPRPSTALPPSWGTGHKDRTTRPRGQSLEAPSSEPRSGAGPQCARARPSAQALLCLEATAQIASPRLLSRHRAGAECQGSPLAPAPATREARWERCFGYILPMAEFTRMIVRNGQCGRSALRLSRPSDVALAAGQSAPATDRPTICRLANRYRSYNRGARLPVLI